MRRLILSLIFLGLSNTIIAQNDFITQWKTDNPGSSEDSQITIPTFPGEAYDYLVDWGDGTTSQNVTGDITHTYAIAGNYTVSIFGVFPRIYFDNAGDKEKLLAIIQWGTNEWSSMESAFNGCSNLDVIATDIPNLSQVTSTEGMFWRCNALVGNAAFEDWDSSNVQDMSKMFGEAVVFNQDIGSWSVGNVTNMDYMFGYNYAFDQDLSNWNVSNVSSMDLMLEATGMSNENYDKLLIGWNGLGALQQNVVLGANGKRYCQGTTARQDLIDNYGWVITDDGQVPNCEIITQRPFITTWKTDNNGVSESNQVFIPVKDGTTLNIDWGDGTSARGVTEDITHTYEIQGTYQISMSGDFSEIYWGNGYFYDRNKLLSVDQWGDVPWTSLEAAFKDCLNVQILANDTPDLRQINSLREMFSYTGVMNEDISSWDFSSVTKMDRMFYGANSFDQDISNWNFAQGVSMVDMFNRAKSFDQNLGALNLSKVVALNNIFQSSGLTQQNYDATLIGWASQGNIPIGLAMGANGTAYCNAVNERQTLIDQYGWSINDSGLICPSTIPFITSWKTDNDGISDDNSILFFFGGGPVDVTIDWGDGTIDTGVKETKGHTYAQPGTYQVSVTGIHTRIGIGVYSYSYEHDRNKLISVDQWGDNKWATMEFAFNECQNVRILAQDVPDLSQVVSMRKMFSNADTMNEDISSWDFSTVTNFSSMFEYADSFNQDITKWNFTNGIGMGGFLFGATSFNQDLSNLDLSKIVYINNILSSSGISQENYDKTLIAWSQQSEIPLNLRMGASGIPFCSGAIARQKLIDDYGWIIFDGGLACPNTIPFITTWKTDNEGFSEDNQIMFPIQSPAEVTIDWGDGTSSIGVKRTTTHTYEEPGTYQISVSGIMPNIRFGPQVSYFNSDKNKLIAVNQWGDTQWIGMQSAFEDCENVQILASDVPDLSNVLSLSRMFDNADTMNEDISTWDFSSVTDMSFMFREADSFNQDITGWNLGTQVNLGAMFSNAINFDQDLGNLDLSKITSLSGIFSNSGLSQENYDNTLMGWALQDDIPENISMQAYEVSYCNGAQARQILVQDYNWYIIDGGLACESTVPFITTWKTDNPGSSGDNQIAIPIIAPANVTIDWGDGTIDSNVTESIIHTYTESGTYQISITGVFPEITFDSYVYNFGRDRAKLISIDQWGDNKWASMLRAFKDFENVQILAQDSPDLSFVSSMQEMFYNADAVNADISAWDVSAVINMKSMFENADSFDQDLGNWNISNMETMTGMFSYSGLSSSNYDKTLIGWAAQDNIPETVPFSANGINYCTATEARQKLIEEHNWSISDGGLACPITIPFVTTWKTDNPGSTSDNQIRLSFSSEANARIDWGDGSYNENVSTTITHTYPEPGTYQVSITGVYPKLSLGVSYNSTDYNKLLSVDQWGDNKWTTMRSGLKNCSNVQILAEDVPDLSYVTSLEEMFYNADAMNQDISSWDFSTITSMAEMFENADGFNQDISNWNFASGVNMYEMFYSAKSFNQDLGNLDISKVDDLRNFFSYSGLSQENYDKTLIGWAAQEGIPSNISFGAERIYYCESSLARETLISGSNWNIRDAGLVCPSTVPFITTWKTDNVGTSLDDQITYYVGANSDISIDWGDGTTDTGVKETITHTYEEVGVYQISVTGIYQSIGFGSYYQNDANKLLSVDQWGDNKWSNMTSAFKDCQNMQILATDVPDLSNVTSVSQMFYNADAMNMDISAWDFSNITDFRYMFYDADSFNQNISGWNLADSVSFNYMFYNADSFDQDLGSIDMSKVNNLSNFLSFSGLSSKNYDNILIGWANQGDIVQNIRLDAYGIFYCDGLESRQQLIENFNWRINDGGESLDCGNKPFVTIWKTDNPGVSGDNQITIPTFPGDSYDYVVDWGDGSTSANVIGDITHTYSQTGTYTVSIRGEFPRIYFDNGGDKEKLLFVEQWGDIEWTSMESAFNGCANLDVTATDLPNFSEVTSTEGMFWRCNALIGNVSFENWDMSNVQNMSKMFGEAVVFNQNIGSWNVGNATNMDYMFGYNYTFDQDLSNWDVSNVTRMDLMLEATGMSNENYDNLLIGWGILSTLQQNVILGASGKQYCQGAAARQYLLDNFGWVIIDDGLVPDCQPAQRPFITTWKTDNTGISADNQITIPTFSGETYDYTVDWGDGTISENVTGDITHTYATPGTYTVSISGEFPRIYFNFVGDKEKLISIDQWGEIQWQSMESSYNGCTNLKIIAIDAPDLSQVTSMRYMFSDTKAMNEDISHWDFSSIEDMVAMFRNADGFNQNISGWNFREDVVVDFLFLEADSFDQDLSELDITKLRSLFNAFSFSGLSTESYDKSLIGWASRDIVPERFTLSAARITYCEGSEARQKLINEYNWSISDDGLAENCESVERPFITIWKTDNQGISADNQIIIPTFPGEFYNYSVDWGDRSTSENVTGDITHTYDVPGSYTVSISGDFPQIYFANDGDKEKLLTVEQWGDMQWQSMERAFNGCTNLDVVATDAPNLGQATSMRGMFWKCEGLVGNTSFNGWDVSTITDMSLLFGEAVSFDQSLDTWNVGNVTEMDYTFGYAYSFDQSLATWDVSSVTNMSRMFEGTEISQENYDATLLAWSQLPSLQSGVSFNAGSSVYCSSETARQSILDTYGWTIADGGFNCGFAPLQANSMTIYPNPATDEVRATLDYPMDIKKFQIFDTRGRLVKEFNAQDVKQAQEYLLKLYQINPGVYFLRSTDNLGYHFQKRLVIKR